jgi:RNA polymerase sigma-70 factor (ECF subfamily)
MKDWAIRRHRLDDRTREPALDDADRTTRFEDLFDRHAGRVFGYAARRSSPEVANEVVAETFLVAWRKLDAVPEEALPWLLNVAGKVLANRRRTEDRRSALLLRRGSSLVGRPGPDPADAVSTRLLVEEALGRLPPAEREAVTLVAWDGLDVAEAAIVAGCSRATFAVRLHRARRKLMKELGLWRRSPAAAPTTSRPVPAKETNP